MFTLSEIKSNPFSKDALGEYKKLNSRLYQHLAHAINAIRGKAVIHISSTASGGGVAEILTRQVPLENSLGLKSYWLVIKAPQQFFAITKKIHNFLQGKSGFLGEREKMFYLSTNHKLGKTLRKLCQQFDSGVVVVHDPQPLPLVNSIPPHFLPVLRLHVDLSSPNPSTLDFLRPFIDTYSRVILSSKEYQSSFLWLRKSKIKIIPPAIDPLSGKNQPMNQRTAENILQQFGINFSRPLITQVSRFDPWKDPLGVIQAYYLAKNNIKELQLVLAGLETATDDPEAEEIFKKVQKHARGDPDIFLFSDPKQLRDISNDVFINALYTASTVVVQKSIREGFGLTITEAMWKGKPVIAGKTSGTVLQIKTGTNGILVSSPQETAKAIVRLLANEALRKRLGQRAKQSVRRKFLLPRLVLDMVRVYAAAPMAS